MILGGVSLKKYDSIYYWQNYLCKQDEMYINYPKIPQKNPKVREK